MCVAAVVISPRSFNPQPWKRFSIGGGRVARAMHKGRVSVLGQVDLIRFARLSQRSLGRLRLECVPLLQTAFRCKKLLETRVCAANRKKASTSLPAWQPLFNKPEREIVPKVKLSLVRDLDVPIRCFQIVGTFVLLDRIHF